MRRSLVVALSSLIPLVFTLAAGAQQPQVPNELAFSNIPSEVKKEIEKLYSVDPAVQTEGAQRLGALGAGAAPAVSYMVANLGASHVTDATRQQLVESLVKIGEPSLKPLIKAFGDKNPLVRRCAAAGLGLLKAADAVEPLKKASLNDTDETVRRSAIEALRQMQAKGVIEDWTKTLQDGSQSAETRSRAIQALGQMGDPNAVSPLLELFGGGPQAKGKKKNQEVDQRVLCAAAEVLARSKDPRAIPVMIGAMKDWRPAVRAWAIWALTGVKDSRTVKPLTEALKDKDDRVRIRAADALGQTLSPQAVAPLLAALKDPNAEVRMWAAMGLGALGDAKTVDPLTAALADPDLSVRLRAADSLGELKDPRALAPLAAVLKDFSADVRLRAKAAQALGALGDREAVEPLSAALADGDAGVRGWAAVGLGRLGDPRCTTALVNALADAAPSVRGQAALALGRIKDAEPVPSLLNSLKDEDAGVRSRVAFALGQIGDARAADALKTAAADPDPRVQSSAQEALRRIKIR